MISAIILTKNEEANIKECLDSLSWCDEKIIIDDQSHDNTREIAEKLGAKVYIRQLINFSDQRNFGLDKAKGEWVFFVDADERISQALWYEIMEEINNPLQLHKGFFLNRFDYMWGHELKYGDAGNTRIIRLAKKGYGKWQGRVHEKWQVTEKIGNLKNPINHYPHPTVASFMSDINKYTDFRALELYNYKVKTNWLLIIIHTKLKFIQNYFIKLGFLDGLPGLICALMMSFHAFLVRAKLWLLWQKEK